MKLNGASYMDIHKKGGGIGFTVDCVRKASFERLLSLLLQRLRRMSRNGTTLLEAKSGYGLDAVNEAKMLRVIEAANDAFDGIDLVANYCGGHSIGKEFKGDAKGYTDDIINNQLPMIAALGLKSLRQIDVFHEAGIFGYDDARRILVEGITKYGLTANFHGDELSWSRSAELGAAIN